MTAFDDYRQHVQQLRHKWHGDEKTPGDVMAVTVSEGRLLAYIALLEAALGAASFYINASDRELEEKGMTREDALRKFHEWHALAAPP